VKVVREKVREVGSIRTLIAW